MRLLRGLLLVSLLAAPLAVADDGEEIQETVTGKPMPETGPKIPEHIGRSDEPSLTEAQLVALAAKTSGLTEEYVRDVRDGLELLYLRDYKGARDWFAKLETDKYPGSGLQAVADTLVWQALMLENFDFKYDKQYQVATKRARNALEKALKTKGTDGWEHFLMAGIVGIESIHLMRQERYLPALQLAFEAMDHAAASRKLLPDFADLTLADGIYNYWRTVVTMHSKVLPDFGDHRVEGIQQMVAVERKGAFLSAPASMALTFTWIEEREYSRAASTSLKLREGYPDNVINNILLARIYTSQKKYDSALSVLDDILRVAPDNKRAQYYKGLACIKAGRHAEAEAPLLSYLEADYLEIWQRSAAHDRLGQVYYKLKRWDDAEAQWKAAIKLDGNASAKARLARLEETQKEQAKAP
jgi:tetratricopeptide (TPR) repeat protein